ncbi:MAG: aminoacyl-tRNA hydrolase [Alphaproteobacteria bacterium]|jgi:PTH1 family peptidyl-tRNA hydrolase
MRLLVGLGNPGTKYAHNRHNIGFMAVDEIVRRHGFGAWRGRFQSQCAEGIMDGNKILAIKPETFMNESGLAVGAALRFFKLEAEDVIVIHDEIDLAPGKVRIKQGGGHAGHNGLRDIDAHIGKNYHRVRMGVGHPGLKERVTGHVLDDFSKADMVWLSPLLDAVAEAFPKFAANDEKGFTNTLGQIIGPQETPKKTKDDRET